MTQDDKARMFRAIHSNTFILPNAWDVASARIFEEEKFAAVGTTSAGIAFALGYPDGQQVPPGEMLAVVKRIATALQAPVTADVEGGYGDPVATALGAWEAGAVGINLEDAVSNGEPVLLRLSQQADLIRQVRQAVPALFINARTDIFLMGIGDERTRLAVATERLRTYREAGADCLFAPGLKDKNQMAELAAALDAPLNILAGPGCPSLAEMKRMGVKRISVGSGPMRACLGLVTRIAQELQNSGSFQAITEGQYPYSEANRLFHAKT